VLDGFTEAILIPKNCKPHADKREENVIEGSKSEKVGAKLAYAMVGGGPGAFIGDVHRTAIRIDDKAELVCGVFSRDAAKSKEFGLSLGLDPERLYSSVEEMAEKESKRPDGIDFAVIVTPNAAHYNAAKVLLNHSINVVCDKPLTIEFEEAQELVKLTEEKDLLFGVTYTYTGYPVAKQIRHLIQAGEIGEIRFVNAEYPQEWLASRSEDEGNKQAAWRTDPALSGKSNCVGDIGSHIENMVATLTGLKIKRLSARLDKYVEGRSLDDNATIMVEYDNGAKGVYWSSQIAIGYDNALRVRIFGSQGTIEWSPEDPDHFILTKMGGAKQLISRGRDPFVEGAQKYSRLPSGHPEGVFEAFANIYKAYVTTLIGKLNGEKIDRSVLEFPTVADGAEGVKFIVACVESSEKDAAWISL